VAPRGAAGRQARSGADVCLFCSINDSVSLIDASIALSKIFDAFLPTIAFDLSPTIDSSTAPPHPRPQLIKRRGKSGLLLLNAAWADAAAWLRDHRNREVQIGETRGALTSFIVEPFVAHAAEDEYYVAIQVRRLESAVKGQS
jgi:hypothetical protein